MRIEANYGLQSVSESNRSSAQNVAAGSSSVSNALGEDQARLSGVHHQVQALAAQAAQLPEVREEQVHALRQAVQSGHYHPSSEKVAGAIFTHMVARSAA
jgi:flagellar biosynthesis anti-sigma factor FlgM